MGFPPCTWPMSFYPAGWLLLLPCHCIPPAIISLISLPCCYFWAYGLKHLPCQFLILFLLLVLLPSILAGPTHSVPWASSAYFILWASSAHFIIWAFLAHSIISYIFPFHGFLLNLLGLPGTNYHILLWAYWLLNQPHLLIHFYRLSWPIFAFFPSLTIPMGLLLHSLGLPRPIFFLSNHLLF